MVTGTYRAGSLVERAAGKMGLARADVCSPGEWGPGEGMALEPAWVGDLRNEGVQTFPSTLVPKLCPQGCGSRLPPLGPEDTQPWGLFLVGGLGLLPTATAHPTPAGPGTTHTIVLHWVSTRAVSAPRDQLSWTLRLPSEDTPLRVVFLLLPQPIWEDLYLSHELYF